MALPGMDSSICWWIFLAGILVGGSMAQNLTESKFMRILFPLPETEPVVAAASGYGSKYDGYETYDYKKPVSRYGDSYGYKAPYDDYEKPNCYGTPAGYRGLPAYDCRQFEVCQSDGRLDIFYCPAYTKFNNYLSTCDWPYQVDRYCNPAYPPTQEYPSYEKSYGNFEYQKPYEKPKYQSYAPYEPKYEAKIYEPKYEAKMLEPKYEAKIYEPKYEAKMLEPKYEAKLVDPKYESKYDSKYEPKYSADVYSSFWKYLQEMYKPKASYAEYAYQPKYETNYDFNYKDPDVYRSKYYADYEKDLTPRIGYDSIYQLGHDSPYQPNYAVKTH